jgi:hypothetical protein
MMSGGEERMKRPSNAFALLLIFTLALGVYSVYAQEIFTREQAKRFLEDHDFLVTETLNAYNNGNHAQFYGNFASGRLSKTKKAFSVIWQEGYKGKYGNYISRKLVREMCSFNDMYPLLVYNAKFEKQDNVTIKVSFKKEGSLYRIFYMRFDHD